MTQSLLNPVGLDWPVADYSTGSRRQKTLQVAIKLAPTTTSLHLLVANTAIKMLDVMTSAVWRNVLCAKSISD